MMAYLLYLSNSQTSLACLLAVAILFCATRLPFLQRMPVRTLYWVIGLALLFWYFAATYDISRLVFNMLGRDATLTNRSNVWELARSMKVNDLLGAGFMSFWTGDRIAAMWQRLGPGINQAHNGYLEQYLNLGYVGVAFIVLIIASSLVRIHRQFSTDAPAALLRLSLVLTAVLYNITEASFYGVNNIWLLFLLATIDISNCRKKKVQLAPILTIPLRRLPGRRKRVAT